MCVGGEGGGGGGGDGERGMHLRRTFSRLKRSAYVRPTSCIEFTVAVPRRERGERGGKC